VRWKDEAALAWRVNVMGRALLLVRLDRRGSSPLANLLSLVCRQEPETKFLILMCSRRSTGFKGLREGMLHRPQT
jgi:hypothetical protein